MLFLVRQLEWLHRKGRWNLAVGSWRLTGGRLGARVFPATRYWLPATLSRP